MKVKASGRRVKGSGCRTSFGWKLLATLILTDVEMSDFGSVTYSAKMKITTQQHKRKLLLKRENYYTNALILPAETNGVVISLPDRKGNNDVR